MEGRANLKSSGNDEGNGGGRAEGCPAMAKGAGCGVEEGGEELLRVIEGESEAEEIGVARVGIFFVAGRIGRS